MPPARARRCGRSYRRRAARKRGSCARPAARRRSPAGLSDFRTPAT
ncbi:hypothetical protein [Lysobacter gummosus]